MRFWRLPEFATFLGDQGRDMIVLKRMLTLEHFPAIGPVSSVGNVYLGPFYYYFIAPWLAFFRFDPIGPAIGVALFSSLFIPITYFIVKDLVDKKTAILTSVLIAFSSTLIDFSKFSWNPNLLPLFSLLTIYFFIKAFSANKRYWFILGGAFLSFSIQLHYLALFLGLTLIFYTIANLRKNKKQLAGILYSGLSFLFFTSPLILFDIRHNFLNSKNFLNFFQTSGNIASDKVSSLLNTFQFLNKYTFGADVHLTISLLLITFIVVSYLVRLKNTKEGDILFFFILTLFGIGLYGGPKYPHYFAIVYPLYFIVISFLLTQLWDKSWTKLLAIVFLLGFIYLNAQNYYFLTGHGSNQIERAKQISQIISNNVSTKNYTLTALPEVYSDHTARYFLELWGKKPVERGDTKKTNELFVICEQPCKPLGAPIWDIAHFNPTKIVGQWKVDSVRIYKLIQ